MIDLSWATATHMCFLAIPTSTNLSPAVRRVRVHAAVGGISDACEVRLPWYLYVLRPPPTPEEVGADALDIEKVTDDVLDGFLKACQR